MNEEERRRIAANCHGPSWQRLRPLLAALHVAADAGPEQVADWLEEAFAPAQAEARRVLLAIARLRWQVQGLPGPYNGARLGFRVIAGANTWWLQLVSAPALHVHAIERFTRSTA